jgi:hypothetical protein
MNNRTIPMLLALAYTLPAQSYQFNTQDKVQSSLDVTLTYSSIYRLDDQDDELIADPNLDDANRNFDEGLVSNGIRAIADFEWRYKAEGGNNYGLFSRGTSSTSASLAGDPIPAQIVSPNQPRQEPHG